MDQALSSCALPVRALGACSVSVTHQMMSLMGDDETVQSLGLPDGQNLNRIIWDCFLVSKNNLGL